MAQNEKGRAEARPIPNCVVHHDAQESSSPAEFAQAMARSVFGRNYIVEHASLGDNFRKRQPSRIRAWRAPA